MARSDTAMVKNNPFLKKATGVDKTPASLSAAKKKHGLGRGLDSLIPTKETLVAPRPLVAEKPLANATTPAAAEPVRGGVVEVPILEIERSPYQPRRDFKEEELRELADSIRNTGIVQPPTVRKNSAGRWELIAGERRLRAALLAGLKRIEVTVRQVDDLTAATMTTTENLQREDLNPIEEAFSYQTLQEKFGLTQADVAEKVGKGRATVANSVRLLELPDEVRSLVQSRILSVGHAKVLLSLEDEKQRIVLARETVKDQLTVRQLERKVERIKNPPAEPQPATPDIPVGYQRTIVDRLKKHLGCAVRLQSGLTQANGKHVKGVLEIDLFDNDDLDRVLKMIGVRMD